MAITSQKTNNYILEVMLYYFFSWRHHRQNTIGVMSRELIWNEWNWVALTSTQKGEAAPDPEYNKAEKNEEEHAFENDLVIASKYEPLLYHLNLPKAWHLLITWKSASQTQWMLWLLLLLQGGNSAYHQDTIIQFCACFKSWPSCPLPPTGACLCPHYLHA